MIESGDKDPFLQFALAKELEKLSLDEAIGTYEQLRKDDPAYVGLYYHLGKCYEKTNQMDLAVQCYQEGIAQAKKQADFHAASELNTALLSLEDDS